MVNKLNKYTGDINSVDDTLWDLWWLEWVVEQVWINTDDISNAQQRLSVNENAIWTLWTRVTALEDWWVWWWELEQWTWYSDATYLYVVYWVDNAWSAIRDTRDLSIRWVLFTLVG